VLIQLEGLPLSYPELESSILPARIGDFEPRMLDELGALGWLTWVGHGSQVARSLGTTRRAAACDDEQNANERREAHGCRLAIESEWQ
jgi:ATP-dependent Lhr-like helicase